MKILFIGDIFGRSGREAVAQYLPRLKAAFGVDYTIANGENAAHGKGITRKICEELFENGVDCITTGNHVWDQQDILLSIDREPRLLRPANFPPGTPGNGVYEHGLPDGRRIVVANLMGRLFMDPLDDPFAAARELARKYTLGRNVNALFIDFHAETTSEKASLAHYLDGQVSAVVGTHTHVPTADARILGGGTAFQTDAGMTGDYDSVIGVKKDVPIQRFTKKMMLEKMSPADGVATLCGCLIETDDKTGLATGIEQIRVGGLLSQTHVL